MIDLNPREFFKEFLEEEAPFSMKKECENLKHYD
jgi:hypothetical protein